MMAAQWAASLMHSASAALPTASYLLPKATASASAIYAQRGERARPLHSKAVGTPVLANDADSSMFAFTLIGGGGSINGSSLSGNGRMATHTNRLFGTLAVHNAASATSFAAAPTGVDSADEIEHDSDGQMEEDVHMLGSMDYRSDENVGAGSGTGSGTNSRRNSVFPSSPLTAAGLIGASLGPRPVPIRRHQPAPHQASPQVPKLIPRSPAEAMEMPVATAVHAFTNTDEENRLHHLALQRDAAEAALAAQAEADAEAYENDEDDDGASSFMQRSSSSSSASSAAAAFSSPASAASSVSSLASSLLEADQSYTAEDMIKFLSVDTQPKKSGGASGSGELVVPGADKIKLRSTPHAPEVYWKSRDFTPANFNHLLRIHAAKGLYDEGLAVFKEMKKRGLAPDETTYVSLVGICNTPTGDPATNAQRLAQAFEFFESYKSGNGGRVTEAFFNALANAAARLESIDRAEGVLDLMRAHGVQPTQVVYTELLNACRKSATREDLARGVKIFERMQKVGGSIEPDTRTYNVMIRMAGASKPVCTDVAVKLFEEMRAKHYQPDIYTYGNLIYACSKNPDYYAQTFEYFAAALAQGFKANLHLYNILLNACAQSGKGDIANALHLFSLMQKQGVERDTVSYNTMLNVLAESQTLGDRVPRVMPREIDGVPQPLAESDYLSKQDRITMAMALLTQMEQTHVPVDSFTLNSVVKVSAKALRLQTTPDLQRNLLERYGLQPDFHAYKTLVEMYTGACRLSSALEALDRMHEAGHKASRPMYKDLLKKVQKPKKTLSPQDAERFGQLIIANMRRDGVPVRPEDERMFDSRLYGENLKSVRAAETLRDTVKQGLAHSYSQRQDAMLKAGHKRTGSGRIGGQQERHATNPQLAVHRQKRGQRAADAKDKAQGFKPAQKKQQQIADGHIFDH